MAPPGVEVGGGFGGDDLVKRLSLLLQRCHVVADRDKHVSKCDQILPRSDGAMAGYENSLVRGAIDGLVCPCDGVVDIAAVLVVDEWVASRPEGIAKRQYICLDEVDPEVAVGMAGPKMLYLDFCPIKVEGFLCIDQKRRASADRDGAECPVPIVDMGSRGQMFQRIGVRDDGRARCVQPLISVGVIPMPVGIDHVLDAGGTELIELRLQLVLRRAYASVDEKLPLWAGQDGDVSTGAKQHCDVAALWLDFQLRLGANQIVRTGTGMKIIVWRSTRPGCGRSGCAGKTCDGKQQRT